MREGSQGVQVGYVEFNTFVRQLSGDVEQVIGNVSLKFCRKVQVRDDLFGNYYYIDGNYLLKF